MKLSWKIEYYLFKGLTSVIQSFPLSMVRALARGIAWLTFSVLHIRRTMTLEQIRMAMPDKTEEEILAIGKGSFDNLVITICELLWSPNITPESCARYIVSEDFEVLKDAVARGRGVVLVSGHYGNWEWLGGSTALLHGIPAAAIARPMQNPLVDAVIEKIREGAGVRVIPIHRAIRETITFLRSGGVVVVLGDQSASKESWFVPFFGIPAATYGGAAQFALKTGAALLMGFSVRRRDGDYQAYYEEIPMNDLTGTDEEKLKTLTVRHVRALERMIRLHPDQWLWQHRRWKHKPPSEDQVIGRIPPGS